MDCGLWIVDCALWIVAGYPELYNALSLSFKSQVEEACAYISMKLNFSIENEFRNQLCPSYLFSANPSRPLKRPLKLQPVLGQRRSNEYRSIV